MFHKYGKHRASIGHDCHYAHTNKYMHQITIYDNVEGTDHASLSEGMSCTAIEIHAKYCFNASDPLI